MQIDYNILIAYGGVAQKIDKRELIFKEGTSPRFFYQVIKGKIKLFSSSVEGRTLIQGMFAEGKSFGEPSLLLDLPYPYSAQAVEASVIVKISKEKLHNILNDFPEISQAMLYAFAERIHDKAQLMQVWTSKNPEERIEQFLIRNKPELKLSEKVIVPFTRQQIADFTGLRVETVIRTLKKMDLQGKVKIINHKLYF